MVSEDPVTSVLLAERPGIDTQGHLKTCLKTTALSFQFCPSNIEKTKMIKAQGDIQSLPFGSNYLPDQQNAC